MRHPGNDFRNHLVTPKNSNYFVAGFCSTLSGKLAPDIIHPNMSYIRPESFYRLLPCKRPWQNRYATAMDGGSVENAGAIFYQYILYIFFISLLNTA